MAVIWNERRADGTKAVLLVDYDAGTTVELSAPPPLVKEKGMTSLSNGIIGGPEVKAKAEALDRQLGVADKVTYEKVAEGAYVAKYASVSDFDTWMHKHKRVNAHAGCGTPAPGDFRKQYPGEFE